MLNRSSLKLSLQNDEVLVKPCSFFFTQESITCIILRCIWGCACVRQQLGLQHLVSK